MENPFEETTTKRPTFLIILCILTFIGSGWGVLANLVSLFTAGMMQGHMSTEMYSSIVGEMESQGVNSFFSRFFSTTMETMMLMDVHAKNITIFHLILSVLSLSGALLMFQLRRWGFYLYAASQILSLFILPYFVGFNVTVILGMLFSGVATLAFIILYSLNLKYMNR